MSTETWHCTRDLTFLCLSRGRKHRKPGLWSLSLSLCNPLSSPSAPPHPPTPQISHNPQHCNAFSNISKYTDKLQNNMAYIPVHAHPPCVVTTPSLSMPHTHTQRLQHFTNNSYPQHFVCWSLSIISSRLLPFLPPAFSAATRHSFIITAGMSSSTIHI